MNEASRETMIAVDDPEEIRGQQGGSSLVPSAGRGVVAVEVPGRRTAPSPGFLAS
jgi:hypothetical protein